MSPHQADIDALSHTDPYVRAAAAERLGEARCTEALVALIATMNWRQDNVEDEIEGRYAAVTALGKLGDPRAIPALMAFLESSFHPGPREVSLICDAMVSLAELQADEALPFFERVVHDGDGDFEEVKVAMWCLRQYSSYDTVPVLLGVLADRSAPWRGCAARNLGLIGDSRAQQLLATIMEDDSEGEWLRYNAAEALGRIGGEGIFERLLSAFLDSGLNNNVKYGVTEGLGHLGDRRAFEPLSEALKSSEWPIFIVEALGNLRDRRAAAMLIGCLQHRRCEVVEKAATALGQLGDPSAIEPLRRARLAWGDDALGLLVKMAIDKAIGKLSPDAPSETGTHNQD